MISNQAPTETEGAIIACKEQDINLFLNLNAERTFRVDTGWGL